MSAAVDLPLAFSAGLLGSAHCLGMCGSLVSAFFLRLSEASAPPASTDVRAESQGGAAACAQATPSRLGPASYAAYHGGRLAVYALFGTLAALVGLALTSTGLIGKAQGILQILAGLIVILLGFDLLGLKAFQLPFLRVPVRLFRTVFLQATARGPVLGAAVGGVLNGFMPCALTLAMAVKATTVEAPWQGTLLMLVFGLGTLPSMLLVSVLFGRLGTRTRGRLLKGAAVIVILLGIGTLYQGVVFFNVMKNLPNW